LAELVVDSAGEASPASPAELRLMVSASLALSGERRGVRAVLPFLGPAFIASIIKKYNKKIKIKNKNKS